MCRCREGSREGPRLLLCEGQRASAPSATPMPAKATGTTSKPCMHSELGAPKAQPDQAKTEQNKRKVSAEQKDP